jgi:hypothetical protein
MFNAYKTHLTANHETVLADQTGLVSADTARRKKKKKVSPVFRISREGFELNQWNRIEIQFPDIPLMRAVSCAMCVES